jgi:multidrug resistance efflux pump
VERARQLLADAELRAPFDVLVLQRHAEPGLVITSQCQPAAVLTVARADHLLVRARLDAARARAVKLGDAAQVVLADSSLQGQVSAISVDPDRHYEIEVVVPRTSGLLPGDSVRLRLP